MQSHNMAIAYFESKDSIAYHISIYKPLHTRDESTCM